LDTNLRKSQGEKQGKTARSAMCAHVKRNAQMLLLRTVSVLLARWMCGASILSAEKFIKNMQILHCVGVNYGPKVVQSMTNYKLTNKLHIYRSNAF
jgi:hypothetical protein